MRALYMVVVGALALVGCSKDSASGGTADAASNASPSSNVATSTPASTLTQKDLDDAYKAKNMMDPFDKQLATVEGKIGKAQKIDADTYYWRGWDAVSKTCYELDMNQAEGNSLGGTTADKCGMKP